MNPLTEVHAWVAELLGGAYRESPEDAGALVLGDGRRLDRVRVYGLVVGTDELVVDDGTGSMLVRSFDRTFQVNVGSPVLVIGRPREYGGEKYVLGEIVKAIDPKWVELARKKNPYVAKEKERSNSALDVVRELDLGDGADYDAVVAKLGAGSEDKIVHLLAVGELFETKPGKLKVLE